MSVPAFRDLLPRLRRSLLAWFRRRKRDLPWRHSADPYRVWISEVILQQTRVDQGLPYYERFVKAFPNVDALARAPLDRVLKAWEGLGYYARARNLHKAARIVSQTGRFPATAAEWAELPGVGRYTANAIASIAFAERVPVVDGNVQRVLARVFNITDSIDAAATRQRLWALAGSLVPAKSPGDFNQALMELGARVCVPRKPLCADCPLRARCKALAAGVQEARPVRAPKKQVPHVNSVAAVIQNRGRLLIGRRPNSGMLGGLWEFPAFDTRKTLHDAVLNTLGLDVTVGDCLGDVSHTYSHRKVTLRVYRCSLNGGHILTGRYAEVKWVWPGHLSRYPMPGICHKVLQLL
ncbi:MAG: A/G-specific adenine glycosylase [Candidatus Hydrogenedentes bacterium]|nr:A/G-specific adenine glycosylase [Candidatus Hydrogenedentota bacterium]